MADISPQINISETKTCTILHNIRLKIENNLVDLTYLCHLNLTF